MNAHKRFGHMLIEGNTIIFISCNDIFPSLYRIDLLENKIECLGEVPWDSNFNENMLLGKIDNTIIIAPYWHKRRFIKYDMELATFQSVLLEQEVWADNFSVSAFSNVIRFNNSLFFIGNKNGLIVEYMSNNDQFYVHKIILPGELTKDDLSLFWNSSYLVGNILYLPIEKGGLLKVNLSDFHSSYISSICDYRCFSMVLIENQLWMMPYHDNKIMIFDLKSEKYNFIELCIEDQEIPFMTAVDFGKEVLLIPMKDEKIISVNKSNYEVLIKQELRLNMLEKNQVQRQFLSICTDEIGNTYLQENNSRELWIFNKEGVLERKSFIVKFDQIQKKFEKSKAFKRGFWTENTDIGIDSIVHILNCNENNRCQKGFKSGLKIWNYLNERVI